MANGYGNDGAKAPRTGGTRFRNASDAASRPEASAPAYTRSSYGRGNAEGTRPGGRFRTQQTAQPSTRAVRASHAGASARRRRTGGSAPRPGVIAAAVLGTIAVVALIIFVAFPAIGGLISGDQGPAVEAGQHVTINIPDGSGGDAIAAILSEAHIIEDPKDYYAAVKRLGADQSLKPGDYSFTTLQDPEEVVQQLVAGPNIKGLSLTIPEGLTVTQTAARVEEIYGIPAEDFLAQAKASNYADDYAFLADAAEDSLEGFLCPKTYTLSGKPTADEVIRTLLDQYETEYDSLDFAGAASAIKERYGIDMNDYQLLIMASIIEREALTEDQRYNVSSTFYNRMREGMPLQSDATMMYVTGGEVTADDLSVESPYNTYLNPGLTPTPICTPSLASLRAALEPADTDYLYFFITTEDEWFSATYDDHLAAIEENR